MARQYRTFWDYVAGTGGLYQMGNSIYRNYILNKLKEFKVESILDEGCGTAPIYQLIKENPDKWNFKYKGTDLANEMISVAKKAFPEADLEYQDARHPTELDNSWDAVLLIDCLDHADDYKTIIKEASRMSKKYVIISLWRSLKAEGTNLNDKNMMNLNPGDEPWEDTHLQEYSKQSLMTEFEKNNLTLLEMTQGPEVNEPGKDRSVWILQK